MPINEINKRITRIYDELYIRNISSKVCRRKFLKIDDAVKSKKVKELKDTGLSDFEILFKMEEE